MKVSGLVAFGCAAGVLGNPLPQQSSVNEPRATSPVVDLNQGTVRGFSDASGNAVFLGIPFADTTGGKNR